MNFFRQNLLRESTFSAFCKNEYKNFKEHPKQKRCTICIKHTNVINFCYTLKKKKSCNKRQNCSKDFHKNFLYLTFFKFYDTSFLFRCFYADFWPIGDKCYPNADYSGKKIFLKNFILYTSNSYFLWQQR